MTNAQSLIPHVRYRLEAILQSDHLRLCSDTGAEIEDICRMLPNADPPFESVTVYEIYRAGIFQRFSLYPYDTGDDDDLFCKPVDPVDPGACLLLIAFSTPDEARTFAAGLMPYPEHEIREYSPGLSCLLLLPDAAPHLLARQDRRPHAFSRSARILRVLELSTAHLSVATMTMLDQRPYQTWPVSGGRIEAGYFVHAPLENSDAIPSDLRDIIALAHQYGCSHIRLDRDGEPHPALAKLQ